MKGTTDGLKRITATAQASRYGETFSSTATDAYTVDGTPPRATIAVPGGATTERATKVTWGATDLHSAVARYDLQVATDGGPWANWVAGTTRTQATHAGTAGHRYRFRVRATDALGNVSPWLESSTTTIVEPAQAPPIPPIEPPPPARPTPALAITRVKRTRTGIAVNGKISRAATGRVTLVYTPVRARVKPARKTVRITRGRFRASLRLKAKARRAKHGRLEMRYGGGALYAPRTIARTVTAR